MTVILEGVVGSTAYGIAGPQSDVDYLGVFVAPTTEVLGLRGAKVVTESRIMHNPDRAQHEIGKYLSLALKCNPTILDLLWLPGYTTETAAGTWLASLRFAVLSTDAVRKAYTGYAFHQARRLINRSENGKRGFDSDTGNRTAKHGRHCYRLLLQAESLLNSGKLPVDVTEHRNAIFAAGERAEREPHEFVRSIEDWCDRLDRISSWLPDQPDVGMVNDFLIRIRREH